MLSVFCKSVISVQYMGSVDTIVDLSNSAFVNKKIPKVFIKRLKLYNVKKTSLEDTAFKIVNKDELENVRDEVVTKEKIVQEEKRKREERLVKSLREKIDQDDGKLILMFEASEVQASKTEENYAEQVRELTLKIKEVRAETADDNSHHKNLINEDEEFSKFLDALSSCEVEKKNFMKIIREKEETLTNLQKKYDNLLEQNKAKEQKLMEFQENHNLSLEKNNELSEQNKVLEESLLKAEVNYNNISKEKKKLESIIVDHEELKKYLKLEEDNQEKDRKLEDMKALETQVTDLREKCDSLNTEYKGLSEDCIKFKEDALIDSLRKEGENNMRKRKLSDDKKKCLRRFKRMRVELESLKSLGASTLREETETNRKITDELERVNETVANISTNTEEREETLAAMKLFEDRLKTPWFP